MIDSDSAAAISCAITYALMNKPTKIIENLFM